MKLGVVSAIYDGFTFEEMIDDDILSEQEAKRLAPYLRFRL